MACPMFSDAIAPLYAHQRVLVIGGGHSAANVLLDLAQLAETTCGRASIWAVRAADLSRVFGGGSADQLPARGKLGTISGTWWTADASQLALGFGVERIDRQRRWASWCSSARRRIRACSGRSTASWSAPVSAPILR